MHFSLPSVSFLLASQAAQVNSLSKSRLSRVQPLEPWRLIHVSLTFNPLSGSPCHWMERHTHEYLNLFLCRFFHHLKATAEWTLQTHTWLQAGQVKSESEREKESKWHMDTQWRSHKCIISWIEEANDQRRKKHLMQFVVSCYHSSRVVLSKKCQRNKVKKREWEGLLCDEEEKKVKMSWGSRKEWNGNHFFAWLTYTVYKWRLGGGGGGGGKK